MKLHRGALSAILALFFLGSGELHAQSATIKLVYASKMPEMEASGVGGLAELGTLVHSVRKSSAHSLFLHGGDSLGPSAMSLFDHGTHMVDLLNGLEPDAMAVNEREFAYKEDELVLRAGEAAFPFVCSNILDPLTGGNLNGVEDFQIFNFGPFKVGVFAVIDPLVMETYVPNRIRIKDVAETVESTARTLRSAGADLVILLTGYNLPGTDGILAAGLVDVILESSSKAETVQVLKRGLLVRQGTGTGTAAVVDLTLERKAGTTRLSYDGRIVSLKDYKGDKDVTERIAYYKSILSAFMDIPVGITDTPLDTTKNAVRTTETAFGNLVTDAFRAYYGADIGILNGGGIRGNRLYAAGTMLTRKDIQSEFPFLNQTRLVSVTGAQLREALENSFSQVEEVKGRFLQVSGISVIWCPSAPAGERVRSVQVGGRPVKDNQRYTVALIDFLADGGDGFEVFKKALPVKTSKSSLLIWDTVRTYIEQKKRVAPRIEGRLIVECK